MSRVFKLSITAGLENLKGLTNLERLDLSYSSQITNAGLEHLKGYPT